VVGEAEVPLDNGYYNMAVGVLSIGTVGGEWSPEGLGRGRV